jgi:hypothetical protein
MKLNFYNKAEFIHELLIEHEKGYSDFFSMIEIEKSTHGKEFLDAVWKHLNTNIEYTDASEMVSMIESAMQPYIIHRLNETLINKEKLSCI